MTEENYLNLLRAFTSFAVSLEGKPLEKWLTEIEKYDAVGCFFDPTGWMKAHGNIPAHREFLQLAIKVRDFGKKHLAEMPEGQRAVARLMARSHLLTYATEGLMEKTAAAAGGGEGGGE